eukprot:12774230-Alexandrium_andersonii.AAC.1
MAPVRQSVGVPALARRSVGVRFRGPLLPESPLPLVAPVRQSVGVRTCATSVGVPAPVRLRS